jgi:serine protease Do
MEKEQDLLEQIERYTSGQMTASERLSFEHRMQQYEGLAAEVSAHQELVRSLSAYTGRKKLQKKLDALHHKMNQELSRTTRPFKNKNLLLDKKTWGAAASLALVISIGTYLVMNYVNSIGNDDKAYYRELRLDLERVKHSQNKIIKELTEEKPVQEQASFGGTAIAISADGYVLTSYHVVKDVEVVYIENKKHSRLKLKKVYTDPRLDLVIMKVEDDSFKTFGPLPFTFRKTALELGEKVYTLGYPKREVVFGEGYISSVNGYEGDTASYQIAVPVNPGQSGGPLFDEQGNLVGIVSGKHTEYEGSAFAVKANYLKQAIHANDSLNASIKLSKTNNLRHQNKIQMIRKMQDYVFQVKGYN